MIEVVPVPQLRDNYAYLVVEGARAAVVDPAEAPVVEAALAARGLELIAILNTHHHPDHVGGNAALAAARPGLRVIGSAADGERIPAFNEAARGVVDLFGGVRVHDVPCHTRGHVAYQLGDELFAGDTLLLGGCGRFFEGAPEDMQRALYEVLGALPGETRVWCGHEYTVKNLEFARALEPDHAELAARLDAARATRARGLPTVPSTLALERRTNPFLRVSEPRLAAAIRARSGIESADPVVLLGALRALKDAW